jgi:hypothetical protein
MIRELLIVPLIWADGSKTRFWLIGASFVLLALFLALCGQGSRDRNQEKSERWWSHPGWFLLVLALGLVFFRLPSVTVWTTFIEDEAAFISGAFALSYDPVFWDSVQSTSSGPLNYYFLLLARLMGLPLDFFGARLFTAIVFCGLVALHYVLVRQLFGDSLARLGTMPVWALLTFLSASDILGYQSEVVPIVLFQLTTFFLLCWWTGPMDSWRAWSSLALSGFFLGCLPWAKFQAVPAGLSVAFLVMAVIALRNLVTGKRIALGNLLVLLAAGLLPTALVFFYAYCLNVWNDMWISYIYWNFSFASQRISQFSFLQRTLNFFEAVFWAPYMREFSWWWLGTVLVVCLLKPRAVLAGLGKGVPFPALLAGVTLVFLAFSIILAGTIQKACFGHYLLFLFFPLAMLQSYLFGLIGTPAASEVATHRITRRYARRRMLVQALVILSVIHMGWSRWNTSEPYLMHAASYGASTPPFHLVNDVLVYSKPDDAILVWGWQPRLYVMSQRRQGSPYQMTQQEFESYETEYFIDKMVTKVRCNRPAVIIDEVSPASCGYKRRDLHGHEAIPALADFIKKEYSLIRDRFDGRVYVRNDVLAAMPAPAPVSEWQVDIRVAPEKPKFNRKPCFAVEAVNQGKETWFAHGSLNTEKGKVSLYYTIHQEKGDEVLETNLLPLPKSVAPGEGIQICFDVLQPLPPGKYYLKVSLLQKTQETAYSVADSSPSVTMPFEMLR